MRSISFAVLVLLLCTQAIQSQEIHATIYGTISTKSDSILGGVQVIIQMERCECTICENEPACDCCPGLTLTVSDQRGYYTATVPAGTYSVRINHPGYPRIFAAHNELKSGTRWKKDFKL